MNNLIKLEVVQDKADKQVYMLVNVNYIELLVDGSIINNPSTTQIGMTSGHKFFVKHTFEDLYNLINKGGR